MKRDLRAQVADPGFTPSARHVPELVRLAAHEDVAEHVERALARLGPALAAALAPHVKDAELRARVHAYRAVGRVALPTPEALALLEAALADPEERPRRAAETALGKIGSEASADDRARIEAWLLAAWGRAHTDSERRALAESLGKVGGERAAAELAAFVTKDRELERALGKARLILERTRQRAEPGAIVGDVAPARPVPLTFIMRFGLERLVVDELAHGWNAAVAGPGRVRATLHGPLQKAWTSRIAERFAITLPDVALGDGDDLAEAIAGALADAAPLVAPLTRGPARFRVAFSGGGHRRALVWSIAERVAARTTAFVNDPKESLWELSVDERKRAGGGVVLGLSLAPRGLDDPRFVYRKKDVPAASHPTIAAALARVAGVDPEDVVWDPFVGSGLELVERARLGPYRALIGSDLEDDALAAARENLAHAGLEAKLDRADALAHFPKGTTLVLTNPPMGRRVHRSGDIGEFLERFVAHVGKRLPRTGRMVWLSPQAVRTRAAADRAGLHVEAAANVDMGGFECELQVVTRRSDARRHS